MDNTLKKWQNQWNSEGVRILVLASLSIQIGLTYLAPFRKRSRSKVLALTIWLFYLTAELVPPLAVGNMGKQKDPADSGDRATIPDDLTILWAPFLLLHLGGPDNITSYSIDDNELWWRLPLGLVVQLVAAVYAFWQSPPNPELWIPTTLVCIAGMIKIVGRTHALRLGSRDDLKDKIMSVSHPVKDMEKVRIIPEAIRSGHKESEGKIEENRMDNFILEHSAGTANETKDEIRPEIIRNSKRESEREIEDNRMDKSILESGTFPANEIKVVLTQSEKESQYICEGYKWFYIFKRLLVDATFSSNLLMQSQDRFSELGAKDALNLVAIELSFMYDILHTKAIHMHYNLGRVLRIFFLVSIIAALVVFHHLDLQKYASKDIIITYILFGAGLILEVIAAVLLVISDWTVVSLRKKGWRKCIARAITSMVKAITFSKGKGQWSRNIGQLNLVGLCLRDRYTGESNIPRTWIMKKLMKKPTKINKWDNIRCESKLIPLPDLLEDYMFIQAKKRAPKMDIYNELVEAGSYRGRKALKDHGQLETLGWSMNREFDECIILWHVATDICYYKDTSGQPKENDSECVVSWTISNYMVYLLTQQQSMMQVGYGQLRFEVTCDVVNKIFRDQRKLDEAVSLVPNRQQSMMQLACAVLKKIFKGQRNLNDNTARKVIIEGAWAKKGTLELDRNVHTDDEMLGKKVLMDICHLAKKLQDLEPKLKWQLLSEIWIEMLGYAAIHCDSYQHAKSLRRGGELLTHVWLLMAHLGVVKDDKIQQFDLEIV